MTTGALTKTERRIVDYLRSVHGRWATVAEIINAALGTHHKPNTSLVRVHICGIRKKLGAEASKLESDPQRLRGYRWTEGAAQ